MRILQFRRPTQSPAVVAMQQDWSQQEMADFYRAHHLLAQNGVAIGIDRGQTDTGDPWMVFFDTATQDVFLHVARFDNQCMLICETLDLKLTAPTIADVILAFEESVRDFVAIRQNQNSNIVLHPAARIIMSISAVFLLFKLENGGAAQAKSLIDTNAISDATRKQDAGMAPRLHQAFARIFDIADAPAAAAAIAGAILSVELARAQLAADHQPSDVVGVNDDTPSDGIVALDTHHEDAAVIASPAEATVAEPSSGAGHKVALAHGTVDLSPNIQLAMHAAAIAAPPDQGKAAPAHSSDMQTLTPQPDTPQAHADEAHHAASSSSIASVAVSQAAVSSDATTSVVAPTPATQDTAITTSLATRAVQSLLPETTLPSLTPSIVDDSASDDAAVPVGLGDITIASLPDLDTSVALFRETTLTGDLLTDTIIDFMARFGSYDVEFADGRVLIEQHDTASLSSDLIGMWTNIMEDGSAISVIGHVDLVTDVTTSLS
ncbi:hypothetical protein JYU29_11375 [Tianweitania sp. BSSL-BM11]|uniref:Uncharacterized protein n=1 Tax=Tianweitania aestuarii TaxID=2814886 RepID=A0ABS5RW67_9HYPH|nr:hypothetical protein [Tianweitania aestuarii]MBS9721288.1 hypothetical protein [Tianweitania aestuarii]